MAYQPYYYAGDFPIGANGTTITPVPAALPLFVSGLGLMGALGWRRKRKAQTAVER
jgi:hypothetical protein